MRRTFDKQLSELQNRIVRMGNLVAEAIQKATLALTDRDAELASQVIDGDDEIDRLMIKTQIDALELFALQQPLAGDLRTIGTCLKLATDLERMADHATDIADTSLRLGKEPLFKPLVHIPKMAALAYEMTQDAVNAFVRRDAGQAREMIEKDHEMDRLYRTTVEELLALMEHDRNKVRQGTYLLHVAKYLERVGDHATNLGEWTLYMLTGELESLNK